MQNPIPRPHDHIGTGRAGEFLAASKIEAAGLETSHTNASCDLHVTLPSGRVLRVEVKTSSKISKYGSYRFHRGGSNAEVFVFVSLPLSLIRIFDVAEIEGKKTITIQPTDFTQQAEDEDIAGLFLH